MGGILTLLLPTVPMPLLASDEEKMVLWGGVLTLLLPAVPTSPSVPDETKAFVVQNTDVAASRSFHVPVSF